VIESYICSSLWEGQFHRDTIVGFGKFHANNIMGETEFKIGMFFDGYRLKGYGKLVSKQRETFEGLWL